MEVQAARIGKPHGIRGEVTVQLFTDSPAERFTPGATFATDPAANGPLTIRAARWNKNILLLAFEEVTDRNRAEELRGTKLMHTAVTEPEDTDEWYEHELLDFAVRERDTEIGKVTALLSGDVQDLLEVTTPEGERILVPFVEEIVPEIDPENRTIAITPPPGLLTLNRPDDDGEAGA